ncbi:MAG: acyl carrier protein [Phycisphaerales bacterium]|nr:MAG: acyl carrier protein [Phycisphaerales bacterium]
MSLENELKVLIIEGLKVEDVQPAELKDDEPLFGEGLGLDSLDAVELVLLLKKQYQVDIKNIEEARAAFSSINTLAEYVRTHRDGS